MNTTTNDADTSAYSLHLLDMGSQMYGDCLLCRFGNTTILIDGGHSSDFEGQEGFNSIPEQLETLLDQKPPFDIDLLIVTHCHSDHIGCLPKMIGDGVLRAKWALVADEKLGFGRSGQDREDLPPRVKRLVAALREEDRSAIRNDAELQQFLSDAETLEDKYNGMLATLEQSGTKLRRYGRDSIEDLITAFASTGLQVLGPERDHLVICAEAIARFTQDAIDNISGIVSDWPPQNETALYRYLVRRQISDAVDRPGKGAALNDQSIVLLFTIQGKKLLLTGDMQFAAPEVPNLGAYMTTLRERIKGFAPFDFVKLAHHASYNGFDDSVLDEMGGKTENFAMSGGIDPGHPDPGVLSLLKSNKSRLTFARTDRNGLINLLLLSSHAVEMKKSRGRLNDFTPNTDETSGPVLQGQAPQLVASQVPAAAPSSVYPMVSSSPAAEFVEVLSKVPHRRTRVTLTIDVIPDPLRSVTSVEALETAPSSPSRSDPGRTGVLPNLRIGAGRPLPQLLFVTNRDSLRANIGQAEADHVLQALRSQGHHVFDELPHSDAVQAAAAIRTQLQESTPGVVLLGGYDVIPSNRLDVLDETLRRTLGRFSGDADNFIVWNDELYGDRDGDGLAEIPVSRIPDAKSAQLVFAALQAQNSSQPATRFGVRNRERPFAEGVFESLPGHSDLLRSEPTTLNDIRNESVLTDNVYFMLHGADYDGTRFWGEDDNGTVEAFSIRNVPDICSTVVLTGCCWGALTVELPAVKVRQGQPIAVRTPEASIALRFIKAGALAFVGCTGTHYSPVVEPYNYFGGPMHKAFWGKCLTQVPPARALHEAKIEYVRGMPHSRNSPNERAIEMKILRQFTCLGLGW